MKLLMAYLLRYIPAYVKVKQLIDEGVIGTVVSAFYSIRVPLGFIKDTPDAANPGWYADPAKGGKGGFMDHGVHFTDFFRWIFESEAQSVSAKIANLTYKDIPVDDYGIAIVTLRSGAICTVESTWHAADWYNPDRCTLTGTDGEIELHYQKSPQVEVSGNRAPYIGRVGFDWKGEERYDICYRAILEDFVDCIRKNRDPVPGALDGKRALEIILAGYQSDTLRLYGRPAASGLKVRAGKRGSMQKQVGIGIIGAGRIAHVHAEAYKTVTGGRLVAVAESDPARLASFSGVYGLTPYAGYRDLLEDPMVDAVVIAAPNWLHTEMALQAAAHGKHIFCQKPLALTVGETDAIVANTKRAGVILQVGFMLRFTPPMQEVKKLISSGGLGDLIALRAAVFGWEPSADWFYDKSKGGGVILDTMIHFADLLIWLVGPCEACTPWEEHTCWKAPGAMGVRTTQASSSCTPTERPARSSSAGQRATGTFSTRSTGAREAYP